MKSLQFPLEVESLSDNGIFYGYAGIFNTIDNQQDVIIKGAFTENINKDIKILWQHNPLYPIGKILNMIEDEKGLFIKGKLITSIKKGFEAYMLVKEGIINGLSIGYKPIVYHISNRGIRKLKKISLWEISLVTFPANNNATITYVKNYEMTSIISSLDKAINILSVKYH